MTMHARVSGTWRQILATGFHVRVSGSWRQVQQGWVRVSGTWRQFFAALVFGVPSGSVIDETLSGNASANIFFSSAGTYALNGTTSGAQGAGNWITPTSEASGSYTIRLHVDSGTAPGGAALDTDLALSSSRTWSLLQSGAGSVSNTVTLTLKDGGGNVLATGSVSMSATVLT